MYGAASRSVYYSSLGGPLTRIFRRLARSGVAAVCQASSVQARIAVYAHMTVPNPHFAVHRREMRVEVGRSVFDAGRDKNGAGNRNRTCDLLITNELLYRLSYSGAKRQCPAPWFQRSARVRRQGACHGRRSPARPPAPSGKNRNAAGSSGRRAEIMQMYETDETLEGPQEYRPCSCRARLSRVNSRCG